MKRFLFIVVVFCAIQLQTKAQDVPVLDLGVRVGGNLGTASNLSDGVENDGARFGLVAGAFARVNIPVIGIFAQPEIGFSQTGAKFKTENAGQTSTREYIQNNLDINVLIGKQFKLGPLAARFAVGPNFSNVLSSKDGDGNDVKDIKSFQTAIQVGVGAEISKINFDLRYQLGVTKIDDSEMNPSDQRLNAIQFTVGYKFL